MTPSNRKAIFAGILGNALEWYDFALYGYFSLIIGETFFPREEPVMATLAAFAVFSVSFFMRPLGALLFSAIGDRYGRKKALSLSMLGMAIPTAGIGLLPAYAEIGPSATLLLILLRLFQGISVGGEMGGSVTYVLEHTHERQIGLASSLIQISTCLGLLAGSLISGLISLLVSEADFQLWGWRIPFLIGLGAAWLGFWIRRRMPESAHYEVAKSQNLLVRNPIRTVWANHRPALFIGVAVIMPMTCGFFFAFVYFNSLMMADLGYPASQALLITSLGLLINMSVTLTGGWLADRWNYKNVFATGALLLLLLSYPVLRALSGSFGPALILPAYFLFTALLGLYTSAAFCSVAGLFDTAVRYSGISLAVNIASPIFGSTAPLLATWLVGFHGIVNGLTGFGVYLLLLVIGAGWGIHRLDHGAFRGWGSVQAANAPPG